MSVSLEREIQGLQQLLTSGRDPEGRGFVPLADAYRRRGDLSRALDLVADGLDRHPSFASAHVVAARVHRDRGDVAAAEAAWSRVLALDPENAEALEGVATARLSVPAATATQALEVDGLPAGIGPIDLQPLAASGAEPPAELHHDEPRRDEQHHDELHRVELHRDELHPVELHDDEPLSVHADSLIELPAVDVGALDEAQASEAGDLDEASVAELPFGEVGGELVYLVAERVAEERPLTEASEELAQERPLAEASEESGAELPATRTLAELLARQGFADRAAAIYEQLLARSPGDPALEARLAELRSGTPRGQPTPPRRAIPRPSREEETEAQAEEMSRSGSLPDGSEGLFAWGGSEAAVEQGLSEPVRGDTIGDYFTRLLAWAPQQPARSGSGASSESRPSRVQAADVVPIESLAPDAVPVDRLGPGSPGTPL